MGWRGRSAPPAGPEPRQEVPWYMWLRLYSYKLHLVIEGFWQDEEKHAKRAQAFNYQCINISNYAIMHSSVM
eukprot:scaffold107655_cov39-Prasinocladus_malaysianus.AAC.1